MFVRCSEKMGVQKKVALVLLLFEAFSDLLLVTGSWMYGLRQGSQITN